MVAIVGFMVLKSEEFDYRRNGFGKCCFGSFLVFGVIHEHICACLGVQSFPLKVSLSAKVI